MASPVSDILAYSLCGISPDECIMDRNDFLSLESGKENDEILADARSFYYCVYRLHCEDCLGLREIAGRI
jgi:hypothetical protein